MGCVNQKSLLPMTYAGVFIPPLTDNFVQPRTLFNLPTEYSYITDAYCGLKKGIGACARHVGGNKSPQSAFLSCPKSRKTWKGPWLWKRRRHPQNFLKGFQFGFYKIPKIETPRKQNTNEAGAQMLASFVQMWHYIMSRYNIFRHIEIIWQESVFGCSKKKGIEVPFS